MNRVLTTAILVITLTFGAMACDGKKDDGSGGGVNVGDNNQGDIRITYINNGDGNKTSQNLTPLPSG